MNHRRRLGVYLLVMLALFSAGLMGPRAWATPPQTRPGQGISVPTATPVRQWSPTVQPGDTPRPAEPSPEPPADTPVAGATPSTAATITPALSRVPATSLPDAAALKLIKRANRLLIWRGQTVTFTLILRNSGQTLARQVSLTDTLPDGLTPGPVARDRGRLGWPHPARADAGVAPRRRDRGDLRSGGGAGRQDRRAAGEQGSGDRGRRPQRQRRSICGAAAC